MITIYNCYGNWKWETGFDADADNEGVAATAIEALADCTACLIRNEHLADAINLLQAESRMKGAVHTGSVEVGL